MLLISVTVAIYPESQLVMQVKTQEKFLVAEAISGAVIGALCGAVFVSSGELQEDETSMMSQKQKEGHAAGVKIGGQQGN
ncbi:MAG: hypothetical protein HEQ15_07435 [Betaproteobacteria bacterium]